GHATPSIGSFPRLPSVAERVMIAAANCRRLGDPMAKTRAGRTARAHHSRTHFPAHARLFAHHVVDDSVAAPIVRKSADTLTAEEQKIFKSAITKAIADGTYARLVAIHADMTHDMHTMRMHGSAGTLRFLPWHRVYLVKFEQSMRVFEPNFFVPHWRWMDQK